MLADDGDRDVVAGQWQQVAVVLEQHDAASGGLAGQRVVGVGVVGRGRVQGCDRSFDQGAHPRGGGLQRGGVERAVGDGTYQRVVTGVVGAGHGQVETGAYGGDAVHDRAPVGHDQAHEAPLVAQHLREQPVVLRGVHPVDAVVRAHDGPRLGLLHDPLERAQVHLAQGALVDVGADPHAVGLLAVDREVLERRADAPALQAAHPLGGQHPGQQRVLGVVLEVAAAQRAALEVDAGAEQHRNAHGLGLLAERLADTADQVGVPAGAQCHGGREAGGGLAVEQTAVVGSGDLLAYAVRTVGHHDLRQVRNGGGVPEAAATGERRLLGGGERG
ncbi:hypothetical protein GCM10028775_61060 [Catellatospora paridis]